MIIAVDFDGTCVAHEYPKVGKDIGAAPVLKWLVEQGHQIILWTMRGDPKGDLKDATDWFAKNGIPLFGVNINPDQYAWAKSPKAYANIYIDDAALGCPLVTPIENGRVSDRSYVDWVRVREMLEDIFSGAGAIGATKLIGVGGD